MAALIGITTYSEIVRHGRWKESIAFAPSTYAAVFARAGASPVLLPPELNHGPAALETILDRLDGLVISGGEDVCGYEYGRADEPGEHEVEVHNPVRDRFELDLARRAWERRMPIFAICRGMQVLNVALGGTLIKDLAEAGASAEHRLEPGVFHDHLVTFEPGTWLHGLLGAEAYVPSHHHQAVDGVASELRVSGRAADGVVESAEALDPDHFALGVQWHPEEGRDARLFEAFVEVSGGVPSP
jgi:gamma-glutamyl-gamma-aminobutyrate hydrolase PuuD